MKIAVVVPTIREAQFKEFLAAWMPLFLRHGVDLFRVCDGKHVEIWHTAHKPHGSSIAGRYRPADIVKKPERFLFNFNDGVRNIGFLAALKLVKDLDVILTLDDDVFPLMSADGVANDPIQEHLEALRLRVPISWFCTAFVPPGAVDSGNSQRSNGDSGNSSLRYMRGFPYGVRAEAEVWVSHGVWQGVHDYDGPTQLVNGIQPATFYKGPIPRGVFTPVCGMNLAFKVAALRQVYFAPMGKTLGFQRFADIWMGMGLVKALDQAGKAMVSGYSTVEHRRASNVFANLEQEAAGIAFNEHFWDPNSETKFTAAQEQYLKRYEQSQKHWAEVIDDLETSHVAF